jgi:hypothetical protein
MRNKPKLTAGGDHESSDPPVTAGASCACKSCDHVLRAAEDGWAVTIRFSILTTVTRWPSFFWGAGGTGAAALASSFARSKGWL